MEKMYFNSWQRQSKEPFGGIQAGKTVKLTVQTSSLDCQQAWLVIRKENHHTEWQPMTQNEAGNQEILYELAQGVGLYFYYFACKLWDGSQIYYGSKAGRGGVGQQYANEGDVHPYQLTCYGQNDVAPTWYREGVVYQIFPDRFYNGNEHHEILNPKKNSFIYATTEDEPMYIKDEDGAILRWDFYGGNLKGILEKIPYLKDLGVTTLYLNPIFEASSNHRYDTADYLKIDGMLGDEDIFKELLDELHKNDMHVILDGVFSHVGMNSRYFNYNEAFGKGVGAYHEVNSPYTSWFLFEEYPDEYKSWWGVKDLPEVNKENQTFQEFIYGKDNSVLAKWNQLGVDGWRLDVADELPDFFIEGIRNNLNQYPEKVLVGEVWEDASNKISYRSRREYILGNKLHGVMNYPLRGNILSLLLQEITPQEMANNLTVIQENYPKDILLNNLNNISTHDTERVLTVLNNQESLLHLAIDLLFMAPGVPSIYYGDEVGVTGGTDPENRKFFPWHQLNQPVFSYYQSWNQRRKQQLALVYGETYYLYNQQIFGILRVLDDYEYALLLVNPGQEKQVFNMADCQLLRDPADTIKGQLWQFDGIQIDKEASYFYSSFEGKNANQKQVTNQANVRKKIT